jgi:hypothetical protein
VFSHLQQATKDILQNIFKNNSTFCPEYKVFCLGQIQNITEYHSPYVQAYVVDMLVIIKYCGVFQDKNIYGMELSTGKILEENLVQSGDEFTFQQDNNLKRKAKSTLELLTKKTVTVPERPSYSMTLIYGKT